MDSSLSLICEFLDRHRSLSTTGSLTVGQERVVISPASGFNSPQEWHVSSHDIAGLSWLLSQAAVQCDTASHLFIGGEQLALK